VVCGVAAVVRIIVMPAQVELIALDAELDIGYILVKVAVELIVKIH